MRLDGGGQAPAKKRPRCASIEALQRSDLESTGGSQLGLTARLPHGLSAALMSQRILANSWSRCCACRHHYLRTLGIAPPLNDLPARRRERRCAGAPLKRLPYRLSMSPYAGRHNLEPLVGLICCDSRGPVTLRQFWPIRSIKRVCVVRETCVVCVVTSLRLLMPCMT